ncbi:AAA family ATPase [Colletotrichum sojae]|uniref:AAA family ATPase n=1 Tax=Colletotrichum sojae TaxID=2175907 RepID=A0A8H6J1U4_9PEZI|nr:AAA family ATPase [Colletotrichum sojae]
MGTFIHVGDVLVSRSPDGVKAYLATSPARPMHLGFPYDREEDAQNPRKWMWAVDAWTYHFDGALRRLETTLHIELRTNSAEEEIDIWRLDVVPLRLLDERFLQILRDRGRTFWQCRKRRFVSYLDKDADVSYHEGERFMVDFQAYKDANPDSLDSPDGLFGSKMPDYIFETDQPPAEPDLLLMPSEVVGFQLRTNKWKHLKVDRIQDVHWDYRAFDHLIMEADWKRLIESLVTTRLDAEHRTDVPFNKGNGLVMLLRGDSGTGKTYTAEAAAERAGRPLYHINCSDLGTKPDQIKANLQTVFKRAKQWGSILLFEDIDVFLALDAAGDPDRNARVSVFTHALEYHDGIVILTSTSHSLFDEALMSRVRMAIYYPPLSKLQRSQLWHNFFVRLADFMPFGIDVLNLRRHLDVFAECEINGRQIRNALTTARQLAQFNNERLGFEHLRRAILLTMGFDVSA